MFVLLPENKLLNLGAICRAQYQLVPQPAEEGKPPSFNSKLVMAMADGEALEIGGIVAKGVWDLLNAATMFNVNEKGQVGQKVPNPAGQIQIAQNVPQGIVLGGG